MSITKKKVLVLVGLGIAVTALLFYGVLDRKTKSNIETEEELTVNDLDDNKLVAQTAIDEKTIIFTDIVDGYKHYFHNTSTDCYSIVDESDSIVSYVLFSSPYCDDIIGYEGPVPFAIILDSNYRVIKLYLLKNQETQEWIDMLYDAALFDKWNGFTPIQAIDASIDAVSGATYSSDAIIESVRRRMTLFLSEAGDDVNNK